MSDLGSRFRASVDAEHEGPALKHWRLPDTWLRTRGEAPDRPGRRIVASLYAQLEGGDESSTKTRLGFAE